MCTGCIFSTICSQYLHKYFYVECCSLPSFPVVCVCCLLILYSFGVWKCACVQSEFGHRDCMLRVFCRVTEVWKRKFLGQFFSYKINSKELFHIVICCSTHIHISLLPYFAAVIAIVFQICLYNWCVSDILVLICCGTSHDIVATRSPGISVWACDAVWNNGGSFLFIFPHI